MGTVTTSDLKSLDALAFAASILAVAFEVKLDVAAVMVKITDSL